MGAESSHQRLSVKQRDQLKERPEVDIHDMEDIRRSHTQEWGEFTFRGMVLPLVLGPPNVWFQAGHRSITSKGHRLPKKVETLPSAKA